MNMQKFSIKAKIGGGFGIVLLMLTGIALYSYTDITHVDEITQAVSGQYQSESFVLSKEIDHLKWMGKLNDLFLDDTVKTVQVETDDHKCGFGKWLYGEEGKRMAAGDKKIGAMLEAVKEPHQRLHASAIKIGQTYVAVDPLLEGLLAQRWIDHLTWVKNLSYSLLTGEKFAGGLDPTQCAFGKWYAGYRADNPELQQLLDEWDGPHHQLHESAQRIVAAMSANRTQEARGIYQTQTLAALDKLAGRYQKTMQWVAGKVAGQQQARQIYEQQTKPALADTQGVLKGIRDHILQQTKQMHEEMERDFDHTIFMVFLVSALALVTGISLALFISRSLSQALVAATDCLCESTSEFSATSKQLEGASIMLAEGATEQAASLEETSASIEEIASMTRQNADNASSAETLAEEGKQVVSKVEEQMASLTAAISEIKKSSEETGKIIKTIDEIAFQTNLLALNASVEAARAGEAGAGFAVVADEVRNLAMRAAEAAKDTGTLIERIINNVRGGHQMTVSTQEAFQANVEISAKIASVVKEIAVASQEQSRGLEQINSATSEMDKVTQQTAHNAQECAAASERLMSQTERLRTCVKQISGVVFGLGKERCEEAKERNNDGLYLEQ